MRVQSRVEEFFNSLTHGVGVGLGVIGFGTLMHYAFQEGSISRLISFGVYGGSLILLYLASTLYHGAKTARAKHVLRICDHASIYLLIAGTYTPFCLIMKPAFWGTLMLSILWPLALLGIIFKIFFVGRFDFLSTLIYLGMGWMALIAIKPFFYSLTLPGFLWVAIGGLFYTFGVIFYVLERIPFFHVIWHLFVLGGSACHFLAILWYVTPLLAARA